MIVFSHWRPETKLNLRMITAMIDGSVRKSMVRAVGLLDIDMRDTPNAAHVS